MQHCSWQLQLLSVNKSRRAPGSIRADQCNESCNQQTYACMPFAQLTHNRQKNLHTRCCLHRVGLTEGLTTLLLVSSVLALLITYHPRLGVAHAFHLEKESRPGAAFLSGIMTGLPILLSAHLHYVHVRRKHPGMWRYGEPNRDWQRSVRLRFVVVAGQRGGALHVVCLALTCERHSAQASAKTCARPKCESAEGEGVRQFCWQLKFILVSISL